MLERIGTVDNIPKFLEGVKNKKEKMFGFGHRCIYYPPGYAPWSLNDGHNNHRHVRRVYKNFDPRAAVIRKVAEAVFEIQGRDPMIDVAIALEKAARSDDYFVKRKLYPNVDFYSGV